MVLACEYKLSDTGVLPGRGMRQLGVAGAMAHDCLGDYGAAEALGDHMLSWMPFLQVSHLTQYRIPKSCKHGMTS